MKSAFSGPSEGGGGPGGNRFVNLLEGRYRRHVSGGAAILEKRGAGVSAQQTSTTINRKKGCRIDPHAATLLVFVCERPAYGGVRLVRIGIAIRVTNAIVRPRILLQ